MSPASLGEMRKWVSSPSLGRLSTLGLDQSFARGNGACTTTFAVTKGASDATNQAHFRDISFRSSQNSAPIPSLLQAGKQKIQLAADALHVLIHRHLMRVSR